MTPTGRRLSGPAADLVPLAADNGLTHTAIQFREPFRGSPFLGAELQSVIPFLERPEVVGIVPLVHVDRDQAAFVYATGTVWSIAEIVRAFADLGETCGHRAGLELAYVASQMLIDAAEKGSPHGVWSHRSLSPWRLMLRDDGQVRIIGHGLPQVELLEHLADDQSPIKEDSFRYAPPERIEGREEDISSDLFALTLIAVEVMVGKPVYDGLLADVRQQATRAEGTYRLYRWREILPATIRDALAPALKYDDDARYRDPAEYVYAVHDLLGSPDIEGPSLMEVVQRVKMAELKGKPVVGGRTAALTREELAAMAAELDEPEASELPPPRMPRPGQPEEDEPDEDDDDKPRWGRVSRGRRGRSDPPTPPPAAPRRGRTRGEAPKAVTKDDDKDDPRLEALRARLRRSRSEGPPSRARSTPPAGSDAGEDDARAALRRRLRERSMSRSGSVRAEPAEPQDAPSPPAAQEEESPRAALSTSSGGAEALLKRLRSSAGRRGSTSTRGTRPMTPSSEPPAPTVDEPEVARAEASEAGNAAMFTLRVGDTSHTVSLDPAETLADAAWRLASAHAPAQMDLVGRLQAGWRIEQGSRWWRGDETVAVLDPDAPVDLVRVPNVERIVEVRVDLDPPLRLRTPIGMAVPAEVVIAGLVSWLSLPDGPWRLYVASTADGPGVALLPRQLLADFEITSDDTAVLTLKR